MLVERATTIEADAEEIFAWHGRPGAFERLVPPWEEVRLVGPHPGLVEGSRAQFEVRTVLGRTSWIARHLEIEPGRGFVDLAERSPFARWRHHHRFEPGD